jgi:hypothetical protein
MNLGVFKWGTTHHTHEKKIHGIGKGGRGVTWGDINTPRRREQTRILKKRGVLNAPAHAWEEFIENPFSLRFSAFGAALLLFLFYYLLEKL